MRRTNLDVSVNILEVAQSGVKKTRIVYGANLNFQIVKPYISSLLEGGLLEVDAKGRYVTTSKGHKFVKDYQSLIKSLS